MKGYIALAVGSQRLAYAASLGFAFTPVDPQAERLIPSHQPELWRRRRLQTGVTSGHAVTQRRAESRLRPLGGSQRLLPDAIIPHCPVGAWATATGFGNAGRIASSLALRRRT